MRLKSVWKEGNDIIGVHGNLSEPCPYKINIVGQIIDQEKEKDTRKEGRE